MKDRSPAFGPKNLISYIYLPLALIYLEVVVFLLAENNFNALNFIAMIFVAVASGMILNLLSSLTKKATLNCWLAVIYLEIITVIFMIAYFVQTTYSNYINIATVFKGAGGIIEEFGSTIVGIVTNNILLILLFEVPVLLLILLGPILKVIRYHKNRKRGYVYLILAFAVLEACGIGLMLRSQSNRIKLGAEYEFNTVVRCFSLQTGLKLDLTYLIFGNSFSGEFLPEAADAEPSEDALKYGVNSMAFDFDTLSETERDPKLRKLNDYVNSLSPSSKNAYTGLFEGKNIIFISVESMSKEMIEADTMPTLYRMMTKGILFEDYYQPYWNGSTSTGEFSNLLGIIPNKAMESYENTIGKDLYFTIGNELIRKGYFSRSYHNGTLHYYDRDIINPNFGYEKFIAVGNGMENALSGGWPESDLEMMQYALPQFMNEEPFSVYFMTITGHFPYYHDLSVMVDKYGDRTHDKGFSPFKEAYICGEIDFEEGVKFLVNELEKAGKLEDTVFVLAPDHFAYGLTESDAWGTDANYLPELFGFEPQNMMERDHNALIIWSPVLETMEPVTVEEPSYSVDLLPTLLNLFGLEFDSRLLAGRDVLADGDGLVIWPDYSWRTSRGTYISMTDTYIPADSATGVKTADETGNNAGPELTDSDDAEAGSGNNSEMELSNSDKTTAGSENGSGNNAGPELTDEDKAYIEMIKAKVRNKITFSEAVLDTDYYHYLMKYKISK